MKSRLRSMLLFSLLSLGFILVIARSVQMQMMPNKQLAKFATTKEKLTQQVQTDELITARGMILDRDKRELALSVVTQSFFANPKLIKDPARVARKLSPILKMPASKLQELLSQDRFFVWVKREVDDETARLLGELEIEGLYTRKESKRIYPQGELGRALIGVSGRDGVGLEGLEKSYERFLKTSDEAGTLGFRDALGRLLQFSDFEKEWFQSATVVSTIDSRLQRIMEEELRATVTEKQAISGQAVMIDPKTGEILAMASLEGGRSQANPLRLRPVVDVFEPGSTFKIILAAAAIEHLQMTPSSQVYGEKGQFRVGNRTIKEFHGKKYEWLSLQELLEVSSNIASAKIGLKLGAEDFHQTIRRFGFGETSGIDLQGEESGLVRKPGDWKPIELANISFGQGIAVTPLQLARAVAGIANLGRMPKPTLVSEVLAPKVQGRQEKRLWKFEPSFRDVLTPAQARTLTDMLIHVTEPGSTGVGAAIEGYDVAGKTGTAQKLIEMTNSKGKVYRTYASDQSIVSFVGFVPAQDPAFALLVLFDDPKGRVSGGSTAAPAWKRIASKSLGILGVPPRRAEVAMKVAASTAVSPNAAVGLDAKGLEEAGFVGKSFREVLKEVQGLPSDRRAKIDLIGYGTAVRQERTTDDRTVIYFE